VFSRPLVPGRLRGPREPHPQWVRNMRLSGICGCKTVVYKNEGPVMDRPLGLLVR